jgi:tRNA modification GTPase
MVGRDRAIVSPYPGTTRDTIEVAFDLDGLLLRIIDTAGIRTTADAIEQEGVRRAREVLEQAELLIVVLDGSGELTADDHRLLAETANRLRVLVRNKCDLPAGWSVQDLGRGAADSPLIPISALRGHGLPDLERAVVQQIFGSAPVQQDEVFLTRARHHQSLLKALHNVQAAEQGLCQGTPVEFVAFDVIEALQHVGDILGESCSGEVLERIFSSFCIGK